MVVLHGNTKKLTTGILVFHFFCAPGEVKVAEIPKTHKIKPENVFPWLF